MLADRTLQMKREYKTLFDSGMTPKEIAKKFGLTTRTISNHLDDIAKENGVSRESLTRHPNNVKDPILLVKNSANPNGGRSLDEIVASMHMHINVIVSDMKNAILQIEQLNGART